MPIGKTQGSKALKNDTSNCVILIEPPDADPHVRWCGRRGEQSPADPIRPTHISSGTFSLGYSRLASSSEMTYSLPRERHRPIQSTQVRCVGRYVLPAMSPGVSTVLRSSFSSWLTAYFGFSHARGPADMDGRARWGAKPGISPNLPETEMRPRPVMG